MSEDSGISTIRLLGLPVAIWSKAQETGAELVREFTLIALGDAPDGHDLQSGSWPSCTS